MTVALIICGLDWNMLCYAKDELKEVRINAVINSIPQRLEALQDKDGILYLSTDVLSNITVYQYDSESMRFVHDASDGSMNYREIWTFAEEGIQIVNFSRGMISIQKEIAIPARLEYNGKRYFPLAELLPVLNANVLIRDGYLYVEDVENSLTNIFATLDIDEYLLDLYDDNDFLWFSDAEILSGWSYLFMTAVRLDLSRMAHIGGFDRFGTISPNTAQIEDYEEIFTSFLSEDTAYLQSVGEENKQYLPLVTYLSSDDYEEEQTRQSAISAIAEYSERLHKKEIEKYPAMAYYCSEYDLISSLDKISTYANNALQIYSYAALYVDHVADHYQMLETVYSSEWERTFLEKLNEKDKSILASKNVYNSFSENLITSLSSYVVDQSWDMLLDEAMEYELFTGPKIAASLIELNLDSYDVYLYEIAKDCQYLGHYNQLMERGYSRYLDLYHGSAGMSYDTMEDARLAAIFTLLTSRASYQAMHDAVLAMEDGKSLYEDDIAEIDGILAKLYLAKNCCFTDSEEYIYERINLINSSINQVSIIDVNEEKLYADFDKAIYGAMIKALNSYNKVYRYKVCDADNDNQYEMAINVAFDGEDEIRGTNILAENISSANMRFHLPVATGSAWSGFIYDTFNDKLLFSNQKASAGHVYSIYSCYENGEWNTISKYERKFTANDIEPQVTECFWNGASVTEDEFRNKENELNNYQWENSDDIFNVEVNLPIETVYLKLNNYLSNVCRTTSLKNTTVNGIDKIYFISAKKLFDNYLNNVNYFNIDSGFIVDCPGLKNSLLSAYTTCFILDETEYGTRIRCQNFNEDTIMKTENNDIISYRSEIPYKTSISLENGTIDNNIISFGKTVNVITKEEVGKLSEISLNLDAKTRAHDGLVLREGPSTATKQIDLIPYGTNVKILSLCDEFKNKSINESMLKIEYNGKQGYVCSWYLLIDNIFNIDNYSNEQKFALGCLLYNQYNRLWFDFFNNGGIFDCTPTGEYSEKYGGYERLEPAGLTIDQLMKDYYLYYTENIPISYEGFNGSLYKEDQGYLWRAVGFGGAPSYDYDEVIEVTSISKNRIVFNVKHQLWPEFFDSQGYEYKDEAFVIVLEDGRWKCDEISPHI